jgi:hypothetical protein
MSHIRPLTQFQLRTQMRSLHSVPTVSALNITSITRTFRSEDGVSESRLTRKKKVKLLYIYIYIFPDM